MRLTSYNAIREQVYGLLNLVAADAQAGDKTKINAFIQRRAREAFQFHWWSETMRSQERYYRPFYAAGTTYAAPSPTAWNEVYHPPSKTYYQNLRSATGQPPAALVNGLYVVNSAYWAEIDEVIGVDWETGAAYAVEEVARNPDDGRYYQCHTAHTAGATFDATKFGILTPWSPYISLDQAGATAIGQVRGCYLDNPLTKRNARKLAWILGPDGIHLPDTGVSSLFVYFQVKAPNLSGADYAAGTAYVAGVCKYYASAAAGFEGDYWITTAATTAGESPESTPAKWTRQELPEGLRDAIAHSAYSDFLRPASKDGEVPLEQTAGYAFLADEVRKQQLMQGQAGKWSFA